MVERGIFPPGIDFKMDKKELEKLNKLSRTKLTGNVRINTFKAIKIAALKRDKTIGEFLDYLALEIPEINKWLTDEK